MLNDLPSHIRLRVYQLIEPKDLKSLRAVQRRDYEFVTNNRSCLRKTPVLLRVRAEEHGFIIDVYKAQFSLDKPRNGVAIPDNSLKLRFCDRNDSTTTPTSTCYRQPSIHSVNPISYYELTSIVATKCGSSPNGLGPAYERHFRSTSFH
ncbi:hypothetical protein GCK32_003369 [Trichostrongylus colubriformis]|uniref:F-box domain-containing protein n=1 Tax=Trichostrongylus colubriformis TaxID=6319 RepID=A0AAN8IM67_TRICO